jgi:hypothetical protein
MKLFLAVVRDVNNTVIVTWWTGGSARIFSKSVLETKKVVYVDAAGIPEPQRKYQV